MSDYEHDGNIFTGIEDELREHREYEKNYYSGGGGGKDLPLQGGDAEFVLGQQIVHFPGGLAGLLPLGGESLGNLPPPRSMTPPE